MRSVLLAVALILGSAAASWATNVDVGQLFILQQDPNDIVFAVYNSTNTGATVETPVDFTNVQLTVTCGDSMCTYGNSTTLNLDSGVTDILAGDAAAFPIVDTTHPISQIVVSLTLSPNNSLVLFDNSTFDGLSTASATVSDPLNALQDPNAGLIFDLPATGQVPEPGSLALLGVGASGLCLLRRYRTQVS